MAAITVSSSWQRASGCRPRQARGATLTVCNCNSVPGHPQLDPCRYIKSTTAAVHQSVGMTVVTSLLPGLAYGATQLAHNATDLAQPESAGVSGVVVAAGVVALLCVVLYAQRSTAAGPTADTDTVDMPLDEAEQSTLQHEAWCVIYSF